MKGRMKMNEVTIWDYNTGVDLPQVNDVKDLMPFNQRLFPREVSTIARAFESQLYDMSIEYTWRRTFNIIKEKVLSFGDDFVMDMLGRSETDSVDSVSDIEIILLATDLGIINETAKMRFLHIIELITHYSSRDVPDEEIDRLDALKNIQICMKYVLAIEEDGFQISFNNFRDRLKTEKLKPDSDIVETLAISPYFYKRTTVRTLLNLIKSTKGAELETVFDNMLVFIPRIWDDLLSDDRYPIGFSYAEAVSEGNVFLVRALKTVLLKVQGFDYVPEDLRSRSFIEVAKKLLDIHYGFDNFHKEPAQAKLLLQLGSIVPGPALGTVLSVVIACKLGNRYGVSNDAQKYLNLILEKMSPTRWESYFNTVFQGDETILLKLTERSTKINSNWVSLVNNYNLDTLNFKNSQVGRLVKASKEGKTSKANEIARELYNKLRGK